MILQIKESRIKIFFRVFGLLATTFVIGFLFINYFLSSRNIDRMPMYQTFYPACFMAIVTLVGSALMLRKGLLLRCLLFFTACLGVFIGVAFDAMTDTKMDRNLFPIEMVLWTVFTAPGAAAGTVIGGIMNRFMKKTNK